MSIKRIEKLVEETMMKTLAKWHSRNINSIYLCGPMDFVSGEDMGDWRDAATKYINEKDSLIEIIDPRATSTVDNQNCIYVEDLNSVMKCDAILVNMSNGDVNMNGSSAEVQEAYRNGKLIAMFKGAREKPLSKFDIKRKTILTKDLYKAIDYIIGQNGRTIKGWDSVCNEEVDDD